MDSDSQSPGPKRSHWLGIVTFIVVATVVALIAWWVLSIPRAPAIQDTLDPFIKGLSDSDAKRLGTIVLDNFTQYRADAKYWSGAYFGCLFLSAVCSALAGALLKLEHFITDDKLKKDLAALLAMTSALLITVSTVGDFHQKWAANRLAAARMEQLAYVFMTPGEKNELTKLWEQIEAISLERNLQIVGGDSGKKAGDKQ